LAQPYAGPYQVVECGLKFLTINIGGEHMTVTIDRLKPHRGAEAATPAAAPGRGHPPKTKPSAPPSPATPEFRTSMAHLPSPGLPATAGTRPTRLRGPPTKLDI